MLIFALDDEQLLLEALRRAIAQAAPDSEIHTFLRARPALQAIDEGLVPDVVFLDIEMPGMSGLELAKAIKERSPTTNLVFVTGFSQYALEASTLHPSGYVMKPITTEKIQGELNRLSTPVPFSLAASRVQVRCFGSFAVFVDGKPVEFSRTRAKEVFALLIHKRGACCSMQEISAVLFEGEPYSLQLRDRTRKLVQAMIQGFQAMNAPNIIHKSYNHVAVLPKQLDCDYYRFLRLDVHAINTYTGEYMSQYPWASFISTQ